MTIPHMDFKTRTLAALREARTHTPAPNALIGVDGFVDTIVTPVARREGPGEDFTPITTITDFARRIEGAAGKSTNIEFYPRMEKLGGNGPIMANAMLATGTRVTYVGALGKPNIHPVFANLAAHAEVIALCDPALTTAVEFKDGKLMLGQLRSLDEVTYPAIAAAMGGEGLRKKLAAADLVALVNWTMVPHMTELLRGFLDEALPAVAKREDRIFFFDLCDPEKKSREDLLELLKLLGSFSAFGRPVLGLNLKEAQRVHAELGFPTLGESAEELREMAADIRANLGLAMVVVHPRESAACADAEGTFWVPGPYTDEPLITTGAGDHFNAGFIRGMLLGLPPEACLGLGVSTSGHYVRTAKSPTLDDLEAFLTAWR